MTALRYRNLPVGTLYVWNRLVPIVYRVLPYTPGEVVWAECIVDEYRQAELGRRISVISNNSIILTPCDCPTHTQTFIHLRQIREQLGTE